MTYQMKFISAKTKIVNLSLGKLALSVLNDDIIKMAEDRVIEDLRLGKHGSGQCITYSQLTTLNGGVFAPLLEYAAIFAVLSWFNQMGIANTAVGPITSVSGDGMAKTQAYYNSKSVNPDALVTAEENYLAKIQSIYRTYLSMIDRSVRMKRYNEHYDLDYNANYVSKRKTEGNT